MRKLRCIIGFHKWNYDTSKYNGVIRYMRLRYCDDCGSNQSGSKDADSEFIDWHDINIPKYNIFGESNYKT